jgi:3',5'-cyclic AMP phosphodiesterase CpdA
VDGSPGEQPSLLATSDLHVGHAGNREVVEGIRPYAEGDWLIVAGDVADTTTGVRDTLGMLRERFAKVIWAPGNHELWSTPGDAVDLAGAERYEHLAGLCRELDVVTPEDPYPVWEGAGGPVAVVPLFLLYDYTWRLPGFDLTAAMAHAYETHVVATDEFLLRPDPYPDRAAWCRARVEVTLERVAQLPPDLRIVFASHWPLHRGPTRMLRHPQFALWCGTELTEDWHTRFPVEVAVYGHLHIPLTLEYDGVRFEEVSLGYPREWRRRTPSPPYPVRRILPADPARTPMNALVESVARRFRAEDGLDRPGV